MKTKSKLLGKMHDFVILEYVKKFLNSLKKIKELKMMIWSMLKIASSTRDC